MVAGYFFLTALIHMPLTNVTAILQALPLTVAFGGGISAAKAGWIEWFLGHWDRFCRRLSYYASRRRRVFDLCHLCPVGRRCRDGPRFGGKAAVGRCAVCYRGSLRGCSDPCLLLGWCSLRSQAGADPGPRLAMAWRLGSDHYWGLSVFVAAMRHGEIGFVAPFRYASLIAALILGFVVFGDWPGQITQIGAAVVVAMGLFTLWRERYVAQAAPTPFRTR